MAAVGGWRNQTLGSEFGANLIWSNDHPVVGEGNTIVCLSVFHSPISAPWFDLQLGSAIHNQARRG